MEWPEGYCRKKKPCVRPGSGKVDLFCAVVPAVAFSLVLLTKVFRQKPSCRHGTPGPGMIDTLSHYLMTALVERECWGVILGSSWGLAHKHRQTHTYAHMPAQIHACTHIYCRRKHTLRSSNTLWLGIGSTSQPRCEDVFVCVHMLQRQNSPNTGEGSYRAADVLHTVYIIPLF